MNDTSHCNLPDWKITVMDGIKWRAKVLEGMAAWREVQITEQREAWLRRKEPTQAAPTGLVCHTFNRPCKGNAGLQAHLQLGHR